ncbi:MAG: SAM-dependent methyltransferase [Bacilli bacterium]|nr:SAM-dependent methyltransferase [Bacilli bacterium]
MKISHRLKEISDFISEDDKLIDIGCDHALLDIYLCQQYANLKVIASDIHEGALKNATNNVSKHNMKDRIVLRLGDGLSIVNADEIDTILISGMGFYTIKDILSNEAKMVNVKKIVIQSNTDVVKLRKFVIKLGYKIVKEKLVKDNDIIYTIIEFGKGQEKYSYEEIYFGPRILENKDELFYEYYSKKLLKYENLLLQLPKYEIKSKLHHKKLIRIIREALTTKEEKAIDDKQK